MMLPLNKTISVNPTKHCLYTDYTHYTELPINEHPGSFGFVRANHVHEGIDLYCNSGDIVHSIADGVIVNILPFTGEIADSPWWNDTYCVMVDHGDFVINYGEIKPNTELVVGGTLREGDGIGQVVTVLKKDKGRPRTMLHLEMYKPNTIEPITEWGLGKIQPENLLNPTELILNMM